MSFQILYEGKAEPSDFLWHTCGKLQNLKLEGNAIKIGSTRLVGMLVDDLLWLRYLMLTGGRDFEEGHSELSVFYWFHVSAPEKQSYIYIYIYICYLLMPLKLE